MPHVDDTVENVGVGLKGQDVPVVLGGDERGRAVVVDNEGRIAGVEVLWDQFLGYANEVRLRGLVWLIVEIVVGAEAFRKHVAEERTLFDGIIEGFMSVGEWVEPAVGHIPFCGVAVGLLEKGHGVGFYVKCGVGEGAFSGEADEVPVDEHEIEGDRVGDEDGLTWKSLKPRDVLRHDEFGWLGVLAGGLPRFGLGLPPGHCSRIARSGG